MFIFPVPIKSLVIQTSLHSIVKPFKDDFAVMVSGQLHYTYIQCISAPEEVKDGINGSVTPPEKREFLLKLVASSSKGILLSSNG